jgi:4-hydroxybenzoate polyprenyltransferase
VALGAARPHRGPALALALARSCHPEPTLAVTAVTTALAAAAGREAPGLVATAAAVLAGQLSVGWCNDAVDAERDRLVGRRDKPVARGEISARVVGTAAGLALLASVPLSLLSGWRAALVHLVAVLLAWAYDLGGKATVVSVVPYTVSFALLPAFVTLGLPGAPWPPWWALTAGAALGAGAHFANVLPDLADDARTGVRGLPHRLGARISSLAAVGLLAAASTVLVVAPGRFGDPGRAAPPVVVAGLAGAVAVLLGIGIGLGRRSGSRALFRVALVLALLDVLLLLARGDALAGLGG